MGRVSSTIIQLLAIALDFSSKIWYPQMLGFGLKPVDSIEKISEKSFLFSNAVEHHGYMHAVFEKINFRHLAFAEYNASMAML